MIAVDKNQFDSHRFYLLTHKIYTLKNMFYDSHVQSNIGHPEVMRGSRFNDSDRIARMVLGKIYAESNFNVKNANSKFISLNSMEIEPYIKDAVIESAEMDYYYTYEKDYE